MIGFDNVPDRFILHTTKSDRSKLFKFSCTTKHGNLMYFYFGKYGLSTEYIISYTYILELEQSNSIKVIDYVKIK